MKTKSLVLLAMALGCGFVAMLGVQQIMSGEKAPSKDTVLVLVARQEIEPGVKLEESQVSFESLPREAVPVGAVTEAAQFEDRALKSRAYPGDVILQAKLGEKGQYGASTSIRQGLRVVTVPVNMTTVHSGMIRPGDRVDVLVTYSVRRPGQPETQRTKTVLEFIEVFAIDRMREAEGSDSSKGAKAENLSVLVTPEQAHLLMLAASKGKLQMALRNSADKEQANVAAIDDKIFDDAKATSGSEDTNDTKPVAKTPAPAPTPVKEVVVVPEEPEEDVWAIEIFEGETRRVETIKVPLPKRGPVKEQPAEGPATESTAEVPPVAAA
ncbi:MAG TPA: Flp pilus assembly protein CpaB [Planctomycetaceae bacterium]|nr:Flp pilus assembly protein CpaB [Planctomycetaceae bacterium]